MIYFKKIINNFDKYIKNKNIKLEVRRFEKR